MNQVENGELLLPGETVKHIECEPNSYEQQVALDAIFTPKRRATKLAAASRDRFGRPVRYFRHMSGKMGFRLLKEGHQTALSYYDNPEASIIPDRLSPFLEGYVMFKQEVNELSEVQAKRLFSKNEADIFFELFQNAPQEVVQRLRENFTYRSILPFIDTYGDPRFNRRWYTAAAAFGFSPYLAMSVGGIVLIPGKDGCYVELVFPDEDVITHSNQPGPEKEVFTRKLGVNNILRMYRNREKLLQEEVYNPNTPIGLYYQRIQDSFYNRPEDAIDRWRCHEDINDYLPINLVVTNP